MCPPPTLQPSRRFCGQKIPSIRQNLQQPSALAFDVGPLAGMVEPHHLHQRVAELGAGLRILAVEFHRVTAGGATIGGGMETQVSGIVGTVSGHHAKSETGRLVLIDPALSRKYPFRHNPKDTVWGTQRHDPVGYR